MPSAIRDLIYKRHFNRMVSGADSKEIFSRIYDQNWWNSAESRSGPGSELSVTAVFRGELTEWLEKHKHEVNTLLDAPCGDFNWMRQVPMPEGMKYIGGDIVASMIAELKEKETRSDRQFMELDIVKDLLPAADVWLCRDVLFHLPYAMGATACRQFLESDTRYFLSTTFPALKTNNEDIKIGWYRPINLALAPYSLGLPEQLLLDPDEAGNVRYVGVWRNPKAR